MGDVCGDNRFEIIKKAKKELLGSTNIDTSKDEMKVIDNFLFRCWQMGWLERYDKPREPFDIPTMTTEFIKEYGLPCPDGYEFKDENGNVINATKIVLEKKTDKYMNENNTKVDMGEVSDGYHTFNELYEYRMLYNAALFNEFAKQGLYDVHKSRKHSDGEYPFGDSNWFIVMAELPTGQISNHYEMKDWDKFQIPEKPLANKWDEHSPRDVADRLASFTSPKKEYPKTYDECCKVLNVAVCDLDILDNMLDTTEIIYNKNLDRLLNSFRKLLICRDAYWKLAGDWKPDYDSGVDKFGICCYDGVIVKTNAVQHWERHYNKVLDFPTAEMRDASTRTSRT